MKAGKFAVAFAGCAFFFAALAAQAQTTAFTYQGKLSDNNNPANGTYDTQFKLFDAANAGTQVGATQTAATAVTNGVFTVQLDFGAAAFPGADRFLEIGVRVAGDPNPYTVLSPRQKISSVPYAVQALNATTAVNATQLGAVAADQFVQTNSTQFIRNQTSPQTADFNVSGNGTVGGNLSVGGSLSMNIVNAQTQYNLGGQRVLSNGGVGNLVAGVNAGAANPSGTSNSIFGAGAGTANASGNFNSFFGASAGAATDQTNHNSFFGFNAGRNNTLGATNTFMGSIAGSANTTQNGNTFIGYSAGLNSGTGDGVNAAVFNTFVGESAGLSNTLGGSNTFIGESAGFGNLTGNVNAFVGMNAGRLNSTGNRNTFFGYSAGFSNTTGSNNTVIGSNADVGANNLNFATAIGGNAVVNASDTIVLGKVAGTYNGVMRPADTVKIPGDLSVTGSLSYSTVNADTQYNLAGQRILSNGGTNNLFAGVNAGAANTTGCCNSFFGFNAGASSNANDNSFFGNNAGAATTTGTRNSFFGSAAGLSNLTGLGNSFFGLSAGRSNTLGNNNSFFGDSAGATNAGNGNSFYGASAGFRNAGGGLNSFFGLNAGSKTDMGASNAFFGVNAGQTNTTGMSNTTIGASSDVGDANLTNATAIGANAFVSQSNSLILGSVNGVNGATAAVNVGIGTSTPLARLHVSGGTALFDGNVGPGSQSPAKVVVRDTSIGTAVYGTTSTNGSGVFGENTGTSGYGVYGKSTAGFAMFADGNAGQALTMGGFVKAMAFIRPTSAANPTIVRCYNGVTGQSTGGCGFLTIGDDKADRITVDFGFLVNDRFVTMTPVTEGFQEQTMKSYILQIVGSQVEVVNFQTCGSNCGDGQVPFMIVIY